MNKLNTAALGGMELHLEDFEWIQNAFKSNLQDFLDVFGQFKIGFQLTNPTPEPGYDITVGNTPGAVYINGELFRVLTPTPPVDLSSDGGYLIVVIDEFFDPTGDELNKAGNPIQTYIVRNAKLMAVQVGDTMPANYLCDYIDLPSFSEVLASALPDIESPRVVGSSGQPAFVGNFQSLSGFPLQFYKHNGRVYINGRLTAVGANGTGTVFTIPAGYRPQFNESFGVLQQGETSNFLLNILTSGSVTTFIPVGEIAIINVSYRAV